MSTESHSEEAVAEPTVRVTDKRRFHEDGEPKADEATASSPVVDPPVENLEVARLTADLEAARKRVDELARAVISGDRDREEFKQRLTRERDRMLDVERGNVAVTLLEAIDELDLCLRGADESPLAAGVRMIRDNLLKKAESTGINRVELDGTLFDPNLAEAADMEICATESDDGRVVATQAACYQLNGRVVRPGKVKVAKYVKPAVA